MGIVYHAHYVVWFEIGRTEFCRAAGLPYRALEDSGLLILVTGVTCDYRRPSRYDDLIRIHTVLPALSSRGLRFNYELFGEAGRLASGESRHVFADRGGRAIHAPEDVVNQLNAFRHLAAES